MNDVYKPSNITILRIKEANYWCIISGISKNEAMNLMHKINLTEKPEYYIFLIV